MTLTWRAAALSHVGRVRSGNEDAYRLVPERGLFLVADGMGGHAAGEVASELATETLVEQLVSGTPETTPERLSEAFAAAHAALRERGAADPATIGMGTTVTLCLLQPDGRMRVAHIGDSRLYLLRDAGLSQLTRDHTWVQREVDEGRLAAGAADSHPLSHILTRVLSTEGEGIPDLIEDRVGPGDRLLLSTDGLTGMVSDEAIVDILRAAGSPEDAVRALVEAANAAGGVDNITAMVVEVDAA